MTEERFSNDAEALNIILELSKELYLADSVERVGDILFANLLKFSGKINPTGKLLVHDFENGKIRTILKREDIQFAPVAEITSLDQIKFFSKIAIDSKKTLFIPDSHSDYSISIDPRQKMNPPGSLVFIPLYFNQVFIGLFSYASQPANSINDKFVSILEAIGKSLAIVLWSIHNRDLLQKSIILNETMSRELINTFSDYALLLDLNGMVLYSNEKTAMDFRREKFFKQGASFFENLPVEFVDSQKKYFYEAKSTGKPISVNVEAFGRCFRERIFPIRDITGNIIKIAIYAEETTEIIESGKRLDESRRELNTLFTNIPGFAYRCKNDENWTMEFVTERFYSITGYTQDEIIGNKLISYNDLIHPSDRDYVRNDVQLHLNSKTSYDISYKIVTRDKKIKWVIENAVGVFDESDNLKFIEGVIVDITRRKRSEILREILYQLSEIASTGSSLEEFLEFMYDKLNEIIDARNCFVALYESESDSLVFPLYKDEHSEFSRRRSFKKGKTEYVLNTGKPLLATPARVNGLVEQGLIEIYNTKFKSWMGIPLKIKDRAIGVLAVRNYHVENSFTEQDVELIAPIANYIALTIEKMRSDKERREFEERFKLIWERSSDGLRLLDADGNILLVNDAYCRMTEMTGDELLGKAFTIVYPYEIRQGLLERFLNNLNSGKIIKSFERKITMWNGKVLWVEVSNTMIEFEDSPKMVMSIMSDITQKKYLEDQLIQSQKMESIGRLAGGVAHDFNNILTVVQGNSEMIKRLTQDNPKVHSFANKIIIAAQRGSDLSKQLLAFAKLNRQVISPIFLNDIISETAKLLEHVISKNIELKTEMDPDTGKIDADFGNIQQVIMNLCINARDAIEGHGSITITTGKIFVDKTIIEKPTDYPDEEYVYISVTDTGKGMNEDVKKHIFEPFFTTKDNSRGTGLGLAIVYGIIKSHKGFIKVDSTFGKGSTFTAYFPVSSMQESEVQSNYTPRLISGNHENILLVDDEELILEIGREILSSLNYYTVIANSGETAISVFKEMMDRLSVVIIDQIMPDKRGSEVAKIIREINPKTKIILSSGTIDSVTEEFVSSSLVDGFIQKPYRIEELSLMLYKIIHESSPKK